MNNEKFMFEQDFESIETDHLLQSERGIWKPNEIVEIDRISELPDFIVHHILSFFNTLHNTPAELVRMSVLSKTWFDLTASFPNLEFRIVNFRSRASFFAYVECTTSRFCHQLITANSFKLITTLRTSSEFDIVRRCIELVIMNGVKELEISIKIIDVYYGMPLPKYRLPNTLLTVSELKSLTINRCELPSSFMVDVVRFKSLISLEFTKIYVNDEAIKYLTTNCPLLQVFHIRNCHGFKRFCVYKHQNVQKVLIDYKNPLETIDIEAPNLSSLFIVDRIERGSPRLNLGLCKKLTTVTYFGHPLPNSNGFSDFLSNFPFIQNLVLATNYKCNNLKFSSHSLKTLVLHSNCDLEDIEFNTPNLVLFINSCNYHLIYSLITDVMSPVAIPLITNNVIIDIVSSLEIHSTLLKACMQCYPDGCIDALWFKKLRLFLDKKNGFKVLNLYIHAIDSQIFIELENLKVINLPPYELEHVELQLDPRVKSSDVIAFVDAVLYCLCPQSLTLRSPYLFTGLTDVAKFAYKKLHQQEDQGHTKIHIVYPSSPEIQNHFADLKSMSMALPCEGMSISFIKEQVDPEEAESQRCVNIQIC